MTMEPPLKKQKTQVSDGPVSPQIDSYAYDHGSATNPTPNGPSMTQALDLATSFKTLVEGLNGQFEAEKAKVAAQAVDLSAKDAQIEKLHDLWKTSSLREESARLQCEQTASQLDIEQRKLESSTTELNAKEWEIKNLQRQTDEWKRAYEREKTGQRETGQNRSMLMRDLAEERAKNATITESVTSLTKEIAVLKRAKTPKKTQDTGKKINDTPKAHADTAQKLRKKHEETVRKLETKQKEHTDELQEELDASQLRESLLQQENSEQASEIKYQDRQITKLIRKDVKKAGKKSEKDAQKVIEKANKEIEGFRAMAEKSEGKAEKYEEVFEAARNVVRSDVNRDWQDFAAKMEDLSEAVKSHA